MNSQNHLNQGFGIRFISQQGGRFRKKGNIPVNFFSFFWIEKGKKTAVGEHSWRGSFGPGATSVKRWQGFAGIAFHEVWFGFFSFEKHGTLKVQIGHFGKPKGENLTAGQSRKTPDSSDRCLELSLVEIPGQWF